MTAFCKGSVLEAGRCLGIWLEALGYNIACTKKFFFLEKYFHVTGALEVKFSTFLYLH